MLTSPDELFGRAEELKKSEHEFVLATVIAVRGATSAKTGSKAIFNCQGKNLIGYVGGGCAESLLARESLEALKLRTPRIVTVNLDDEIFGLMPCGGVMDVYLEPHFASPELKLPYCEGWQKHVTEFVAQLGYRATVDEARAAVKPVTWHEVFRHVTKAIQPDPRPWRESKGHRPSAKLPAPAKGDLYVFGKSRITEELARFSRLLEWKTHLLAFQADASVPDSARVVVASHHSQDHELIARVLNASYVSLVASEKRSGLIVQELAQRHGLDNFFAPAGLNLSGETPSQMAFSMVCEILFLEDPKPWI